MAAYHEAGHALVGLILKVPFPSVDLTGLTFAFPYPLDERYIMCTLAGPLSEPSLRTSLDDDYDGLCPEVLEAYHQLRKWFDEETAAEQLELYMQRTAEILEAHWLRVERIANALLERTRLSRRDLNLF